MPRIKKSDPLTPGDLNRLWEQAVLPYRVATESDPPENMPEGIGRLFQLLSSNKSKRSEEMYCFIMYDIENNRVRTLVAKYLEKKGCMRVQKSIFFAQLHRTMHKDISDTLRKIQATYDNRDSIMILPVAEDMLNKLACIGKEFEWEIMTSSRHTLFF